MTIRERQVRELTCDVQLARYCHGTVEIEMAGVPSSWTVIDEGHACPVCVGRVSEWRESRGRTGA